MLLLNQTCRSLSLDIAVSALAVYDSQGLERLDLERRGLERLGLESRGLQDMKVFVSGTLPICLCHFLRIFELSSLQCLFGSAGHACHIR